jgi:ubiquinone/menaquinone biosynthesis C-methylase UbiE
MNLRLGGSVGYTLLRALSKDPSEVAKAAANEGAASSLQGPEKLERLLGRNIWQEFRGQRVLDFGCGCGEEAVAVAQRGAELVVGTDIQHARLERARHLADDAGMAHRCRFLHAIDHAAEIEGLEETFDCAYSIDAFEHFDQPEKILQTLHRMLAPGGRLFVSFGPPWKHPFGAHMRYFCRWPWFHLLFREETIMAVRKLYRDDGARRFAEVDGGLNQMTLARFLKIVRNSPFELEAFRPVPFSSRFVNRGQFWQRPFRSSLVREYATSVTICRLSKSYESSPAPARCLEAAAAG